MASQLKCCEINPDLKQKLKKFRFRKEQNNAAVIMKIVRESLTIELDEELEDTDIDELRDSLSEHHPRYVVYSFKQEHADGRVSFPLCFIFISPQGCQPEQQMMYAGSKTALVQELGMTKVFELRNLEELTEEWLLEKLKRLY